MLDKQSCPANTLLIASDPLVAEAGMVVFALGLTALGGW